jgi:hypothetical protein
MNIATFNIFSNVLELIEELGISWNRKDYYKAGTILRINDRTGYFVNGARTMR